MTPDTSTNQECRDYIAECMGWKLRKQPDPYDPHESVDVWMKGLAECYPHPVGDSLDAAYAALPPEWSWGNVVFCTIASGGIVFATAVDDAEHIGANAKAPDPKLALLRAACKAWAVVRGKEGKA